MAKSVEQQLEELDDNALAAKVQTIVNPTDPAAQPAPAQPPAATPAAAPAAAPEKKDEAAAPAAVIPEITDEQKTALTELGWKPEALSGLKAERITEILEKKEKPAAELKPGDEGYMYAGKYKTVDDLGTGLLEILKPLGVTQTKLAQVHIDAAKKSGDWSTVESLYKDLQKDLGQKRNDALQPPAAEPGKETPAAETGYNEDEVREIVHDETMKQIGRSALGKKFEKMGVKLPEKPEDLERLETEYPALWVQFGNQYSQVARAMAEKALGYVKAQGELSAHNDGMKESAKQQITQWLKADYGIDLPAEKLDAAIADALKSDDIYEDRYGMRFIRKDGILRFFRAEKFPELVKEIKLNSEANGRVQAANDLKTMQEKAVRSISTAGPSGKQQTQAPKLDLSKPEQAELADDETIKNRIREIVSQ